MVVDADRVAAPNPPGAEASPEEAGLGAPGHGAGAGLLDRVLTLALAVQDTVDPDERNRLIFDGLVNDITDGIDDAAATVRLTELAICAATLLAKVLDERDDVRRELAAIRREATS